MEPFRFLSCLFFLLGISQTGYGQTVEWIRQLGLAGADFSQGVVTDSLGNVFITGWSNGDLDGVGPGIHQGNEDAFVSKFSATGNLLWTNQLGTSLSDRSHSAVTDSFGNYYITGITAGNLAGSGNNTKFDAFVRKYNANGSLAWTRQFGTSDHDFGNSLSIDHEDNLYIAGSTLGNLRGASAGNYDAFLQKMNSSGTTLWTKQLGTSQWDAGRGVSVDNEGNVYLTGETFHDLDGLGPQTYAGNEDAFLTKFSSAGTRQWTRQMGTLGSDRGHSVTTDQDGNIYIVGITSGDIDRFGPQTYGGALDVFVRKYNRSGTLQWTTQIGSASDDFGNSITVDQLGNLYITGSTKGDIDRFGPEQHYGNYDIYVSKLDAGDGTRQWIKQLGNTGVDAGRGITTDGLGNIYVTGETRNDFDRTGDQIYYGEEDIVLFKIHDPDAVPYGPGDYDHDRDVDNADFLLWKNHFGSTIFSAADGNGNGVVDAADFTIWRDNLGNRTGSGSELIKPPENVAVVPEPATFCLMLFAMFGLYGINRLQVSRS